MSVPLCHPFPRILALEIEEHIIDEVQHRATALRCCALVCRAWYIRSRRYLVHTITLKSVGDLDRFCTYFNTHSGLRPLVSALRVCPDGDSGQGYPEIVWIPLAFQLPSIRALSLHGHRSTPFQFHQAILTGLRHSHIALETLQLENLTLQSPQTLLHVLTALPSLRNLHYTFLKFKHVEQESSMQAIKRRSHTIHVRSLSVCVG